jgi:hypothetical protein
MGATKRMRNVDDNDVKTFITIAIVGGEPRYSLLTMDQGVFDRFRIVHGYEVLSAWDGTLAYFWFRVMTKHNTTHDAVRPITLRWKIFASVEDKALL